MARKAALKKNVDPSVSAYIEAELSEIVAKLAAVEEKTAKTAKDLTKIRQDFGTFQSEVAKVSTSLDQFAARTRKIIDDALAADNKSDKTFHDEVSNEVATMALQVAKFQSSVDDLSHQMKRYFDKEKYEITKGLITKIMKEELDNG
jgi:ABC-type transporter Mla subunit MlaD